MTGTVERFFAANGWKPFRFQRDTWRAFRDGFSGLVHAATGTGKTYAVWLGPLAAYIDDPESFGSTDVLRVIWITPLRALAVDTTSQLQRAVAELDLDWTVELRTGDTPQSVKTRHRKRLPTALVTTPESLSVMLSYPGCRELFSGVRAIIVDEWHELMASKRGVQTELAIARLRTWNPDARVWGMSATLGNLEQARDVLLATVPEDRRRLIEGELSKKTRVETLIPEQMSRFPWGGHMGLTMADRVVEELEDVSSALIFTNTRSQTETWYRALLSRKPDWAGSIALHHGSLDRDRRRWVEHGLAEGSLRCVVCTSSLDLGVDFSPVDRVFQVGSPKGIARLLQRGGRSGHQPGVDSVVTGVPTNAFELIEFAAARKAADRKQIESRDPVLKPLDLLVQHLVTVAAGTGFERDELLNEVRTAYSYRSLTDEEFDWVIRFVETGGDSLSAYPDYQRVAPVGGRYHVTTNDVLKRHRMSIGTIVSDAMIQVRYQKGSTIGTVEETFISRLKPGDTFIFAGKALELIHVRDMKAFVKRAKSLDGPIPRWMGGKSPLSSELSKALRSLLREGGGGDEMEAVAPLLEIQEDWSTVPGERELLIERTQSREGHHMFFFPFEGRLVHEGLSALVAWRLARREPITFTMCYNDYGFELLSEERAALDHVELYELFSTDNLDVDIMESLNEAEMGRRQFREVARVAGLVFQGYPGRNKSASQLQASSGLLYDVFARHDPDNLLLRQARSEVLSQQLERGRLVAALERIQNSDITIIDTERITPFAFPIYIDRIGQRLSSEKLADRVRRMQLVYERALQ